VNPIRIERGHDRSQGGDDQIHDAGTAYGHQIGPSVVRMAAVLATPGPLRMPWSSMVGVPFEEVDATPELRRLHVTS
jgi:hypothetical protein